MSFTYEQYDVLHNFISPITGRILSDPNYVLIGNKNGIAIPSPIIIDIRLDLIALRKRYNSLVKGDIIIGHPNNELPNAQVLFNLENGFLYNTEGIVSTTTIIPIGGLPDLPYKNIWIGDITNRPVPQQRVALDNLPSFRTLNPFNNFGIYGLYTGQFLSLTSPLDIAQPTTTQRIDMSNMPHLSKGKMWIGKLNYLPPVITPIPTFPYVQVVGSLNWSAPGIPPGDGDAVPTEIGLNAGEIFIGDPANTGQIIVSNKLPNTILPDLPTGNIWIGNTSNRAQPYPYIDISNLPRLGYTFFPPYGGQIWRGTASGQAVVSDDLGKLELGFNIYKTVTAPLAINAAIAAFHLVVLADIAAAITAATPGIVAASVTAAATFILPIADAAAKSYTDNQISALRLNKISADADVSLYNFKIINLADPINPLDAVNLQTMQAAISGATGGLISSVTGTVNQITANTVAGAVTLSLPSDVIISTSLTAGNLELIGNTLQSNNTNGNILLNPNGTGNVDVNNHRIINVANAIGAQDAVNLQTLNAAISGILIVGTTNQITVNTVSSISTISLPASVIISTSLTAGNMQLTGNSLVSTNTNGNITLNPNGTGNVDVNNHKIINLANPVNPLDAVNLQTLNAAIGTGVINSVSGTTNQITATTVSGAVTLSLPSTVIISTLLQAGNMEMIGNSLISTNINGNISIAPDGSGNLLLVPSPSTGNVGIKGTPSYPLDVFGTIRTQRIIGNTGTGITVGAGATSVTGTGRFTSNDGSELAGSITLTTGTGITIAGTTNPVLNITLSSAMPSTAYTVVLTPGSLTAAGLPLYVIKTSASAFTIRCTAILANSTAYTFNYHVIGN
jgi:hypothetical protein